MLSRSVAVWVPLHVKWERSKADTLHLFWSVTWYLGLLSKGAALAYEGDWDVTHWRSQDQYFPQSMGSGADFPLPVLHFLASLQLKRFSQATPALALWPLTDCCKQKQVSAQQISITLERLLGSFLPDGYNAKRGNRLFSLFLPFITKLYNPLQL